MDNENTMSSKQELIESFRNELPVLRAKARVSQEIAAEKIGISRQTYSEIETGKRDISWTTFLALVAYFQNNDLTKPMIENMSDFNNKLSLVIDSPERRLNYNIKNKGSVKQDMKKSSTFPLG